MVKTILAIAFRVLVCEGEHYRAYIQILTIWNVFFSPYGMWVAFKVFSSLFRKPNVGQFSLCRFNVRKIVYCGLSKNNPSNRGTLRKTHGIPWRTPLALVNCAALRESSQERPHSNSLPISFNFLLGSNFFIVHALLHSHLAVRLWFWFRRFSRTIILRRATVKRKTKKLSTWSPSSLRSRCSKIAPIRDGYEWANGNVSEVEIADCRPAWSDCCIVQRETYIEIY